MLKGIDVSKHNGTIDWQSVKASGKVDFCIICTGARTSPLSFIHFFTVMEQ